jgi:hypothetical protein
MTVGQLIEKLKEFDPEIEVGYSLLGYSLVTNAKLSTAKEYRYGESVSEKQVVRIY